MKNNNSGCLDISEYNQTPSGGPNKCFTGKTANGATYGSESPFTDISFQGVIFNQAEFANTMTNVKFVDCTFKKPTFIKNDFSSVTFTSKNLDGATFNKIIKMDFSGFSVKSAIFSQVDFTKSTMSNTNLTGSTASGCSFNGIDLESSKLAGGHFSNASFKGAKLNSLTLTGSDFSSSDLTNADFTSADVTSCDFSSANLTSTSFSKATLSKCIFDFNTTINATDFTGCTFLNADIQGLQKLDLSLEIKFNSKTYKDTLSFLLDAGWELTPLPVTKPQPSSYTYKIIYLLPIPSNLSPPVDLDFSHSFFLSLDYISTSNNTHPFFSKCNFTNASFNGVTLLPSTLFSNFPGFADCNFTNMVFKSDANKTTYQWGYFSGKNIDLDPNNFHKTTCQYIFLNNQNICKDKEDCTTCLSNSQGNEISSFKIRMLLLRQVLQSFINSCTEHVKQAINVIKRRVG